MIYKKFKFQKRIVKIQHFYYTGLRSNNRSHEYVTIGTKVCIIKIGAGYLLISVSLYNPKAVEQL